LDYHGKKLLFFLCRKLGYLKYCSYIHGVVKRYLTALNKNKSYDKFRK